MTRSADPSLMSDLRTTTRRRSEQLLASGRGQILGIVLIALAVWTVYAYSQRPLLQESDYAWFLDVARHVAQGRGLTSNMTYPVYLSAAGAHGLDAQPFIASPPLQPVVLAGFVALMGPSDVSGSAFALASYLALVTVTYVLARHLLASASLALLVATLLALEPGVLQLAMTAGNDIFFAASVVGLFGLAACAAAERPLGWSALGGLSLAMAQLARANAIAFAPGLAALFLLPTLQWRKAAVFLISFAFGQLLLALAAPLGKVGIVYLMLQTDVYPGYSIQGMVDPPGLSSVISHPGALLAKWAGALRTNFYQLPVAATPYLAGVGLLAAVQLWHRPVWRQTIAFVALTALATIALTTLTQVGARLYLPLLPFLLILAVAAVRTYSSPRAVGLAVLAAIVVLPFGFELARGIREHPARERRAAELVLVSEEVAQRTRRAGWLATDLPEFIAWRADRATLRLPNDRNELTKVERGFARVDYLLLTNVRTPNPAYLSSTDWSEALHSRAAEGYELIWLYEGIEITAVLFERRGR